MNKNGTMKITFWESFSIDFEMALYVFVESNSRLITSYFLFYDPIKIRKNTFDKSLQELYKKFLTRHFVSMGDGVIIDENTTEFMKILEKWKDM